MAAPRPVRPCSAVGALDAIQAGRLTEAVLIDAAARPERGPSAARPQGRAGPGALVPGDAARTFIAHRDSISREWGGRSCDRAAVSDAAMPLIVETQETMQRTAAGVVTRIMTGIIKRTSSSPGASHVCGAALLLATTAVCATQPLGAQTANPRFGRWQLKSDASPPASNIMTYEALGATGMKVTIQAVNAKSDTTRWWYTTDFDGNDMPVTGNAGQSHAAVRVLTPLVNEIINKKDGRVTQRLTNVLSPDGQTIAVIYMRDDGAGHTTGVTFATYERMR